MYYINANTISGIGLRHNENEFTQNIMLM